MKNKMGESVAEGEEIEDNLTVLFLTIKPPRTALICVAGSGSCGSGVTKAPQPSTPLLGEDALVPLLNPVRSWTREELQILSLVRNLEVGESAGSCP